MSRKELGTRLIFGPAMLAVVALVYWLDETVMAEHDRRGWLSAGVLGLLAIGGVGEYAAMLRKAALPVAGGWLMAATVALCASAYLADGRPLVDHLAPVACTIVLTFGVALTWLAPRRIADWLPTIGTTLLGFVLVAWPMFFAQSLAIGHLPAVLFVVLVCKFGDIGAYLVGIAIGRRKLIPHVSPGKTIEGCLGGVVFSCAVAALLAPVLLAADPDRGISGVDVGIAGAIGLGVALNLTTQTGDLIESQLKRTCGTKDSSALLPAHGGILDLIDSLLFSFPVYVLIVTLLL